MMNTVTRMGHLVRFASKILLFFTEYQTPKIVQVKNKKIAVLNRLIQILVLGYIIGYAIIYKKGYQEFSDIQSNVITKVKGSAHGNVTSLNANTHFKLENTKYYNRMWDALDIVEPPMDNDGFFISTNVVITPNQKLGECPESPNHLSYCLPDSNNCTEGYNSASGSGQQTGRCVESDQHPSKYVCEVSGWCPVELDELPLRDGEALLAETSQFTVMIKNSINFETFNIQKRNIENTLTDSKYLKACHYHPTQDPYCPIFRIGDIVTFSKNDYNDIAKFGGVIAIQIKWDCNLDFSGDNCFPKYSFERLDIAHALISPGFNYRYARYHAYNNRTMYKVYGIKFVVMVSGKGGRFNIVPLLVNIGSGVGLLAIATVICDIFMLYMTSGKEIYKDKKYQFVTDIKQVDEVEV